MEERTVKRIKWILVSVFVFVFTLTSVLNQLWQGDGPRWAYWASRFLNGCEFVLPGLAFLIFPKFMMRVLVTNKTAYDSIQKWKVVVIGLSIGITTFAVGAETLAIIISRWIAECSDIASCLR